MQPPYDPRNSNVEKLAGGIMSAFWIIILFIVLAPIAIAFAVYDPNSWENKEAARNAAQRLENQRINRGIVVPH